MVKELLKAIYETINDTHISDTRKIELIKVYYEVAESNRSYEQQLNSV